MERRLREDKLTPELYYEAKKMGYPDKAIRRLSGQEKLPPALPAAYKMVDTCGAEFEAETPYFYSSPGNRMKPLLSWLATAPASRRRWYLVPARSASGRASNSTMPPCTA